jgi:hypothetical protein
VLDFLKAPFADAPPTNPADVAIRLVVAVLLGAGVAWIYRATRGPDETAPTFPITLVLLSVLIAMVTQVIGDNVARAFSLVGALSIVRFRTVVRDTQDTAFVIFAVVIGMAVGARDLIVAGIGLVIVGGAAFLMGPRTGRPAAGATPFVLNVRVGLGHDIETLLRPVLQAHLAEHRLTSIATARQGVSMDVSYVATLRADTTAESLVKALNRLEGVQGVEMARQTTVDA